MKIQLTMPQLEALIKSDPNIEAELTSGVVANYSEQVAKRVATRLVNASYTIVQQVEKEFIGTATWKSRELTDRWKQEIQKQVSFELEKELNKVLTPEFISNKIRSSFEGYIADRMNASIAALDIPGKVREEVRKSVAKEISGNLKISIGEGK